MTKVKKQCNKKPYYSTHTFYLFSELLTIAFFLSISQTSYTLLCDLLNETSRKGEKTVFEEWSENVWGKGRQENLVLCEKHCYRMMKSFSLCAFCMLAYKSKAKVYAVWMSVHFFLLFISFWKKERGEKQHVKQGLNDSILFILFE